MVKSLWCLWLCVLLVWPAQARRASFPLNKPDKLANCSVAYSCLGRCSFGTVFSDRSTYKCSCDSLCPFFEDCCADYPKHCNVIKTPTNPPPDLSHYKLIPRKRLRTKHRINGTYIFWNCTNRAHPNYHKCLNIEKLNASNVIEHVPVTAWSGITYRNYHCARCNGVKDYDFWAFNVSCEKYPTTESWSEKKMLKFAFKKCLSKNFLNGESLPFTPKENHVTRDRIKMVDNCDSQGNLSKQCEEEVAALVSTSTETYKNKACADCHTSQDVSCEPKYDDSARDPMFQIVFHFSKKSEKTGMSDWTFACKTKQEYDWHLQRCRKRKQVRPPVFQKDVDTFLVHHYITKTVGNVSVLGVEGLIEAYRRLFLLQGVPLKASVSDEGKHILFEIRISLSLDRYIRDSVERRCLGGCPKRNINFLQILEEGRPFAIITDKSAYLVYKTLFRRTQCSFIQPATQIQEGKRETWSLDDRSLAKTAGGSHYFMKDGKVFVCQYNFINCLNSLYNQDLPFQASTLRRIVSRQCPETNNTASRVFGRGTAQQNISSPAGEHNLASSEGVRVGTTASFLCLAGTLLILQFEY